MKQFTTKELTKIRKDLKHGIPYVSVKNGAVAGGEIFHSPYPSTFISWRCFGQSAISDANKDLKWLLENIFDDYDNIVPAVWSDYNVRYIPIENGYKIHSLRNQDWNKLEGIKIEGRIGTWYEIDHLDYNGKTYVLFESEQFGDEAGAIVIDYTEERTNNGEIPKSKEICETFDDIETALEDEGII